MVWCSHTKKKVIIKYFWVKNKCGATRTVTDHPGYKWKINGVKKLLKKIDETGCICTQQREH